jgi:hypothetical protein
MARRRGCYPGARCERSLHVAILKNVLGLDLGSHTLKAVEVEQGLR